MINVFLRDQFWIVDRKNEIKGNQILNKYVMTQIHNYLLKADHALGIITRPTVVTSATAI